MQPYWRLNYIHPQFGFIWVPQFIFPSKTIETMCDIDYICSIDCIEHKIMFRLLPIKKKKGPYLTLTFVLHLHIHWCFIYFWLVSFFRLFVFGTAALIHNYWLKCVHNNDIYLCFQGWLLSMLLSGTESRCLTLFSKSGPSKWGCSYLFLLNFHQFILFRMCCLCRLLWGPCPMTSKGYLYDSFCFPKIEFSSWGSTWKVSVGLFLISADCSYKIDV